MERILIYLENSICIDATINSVWDALSDLEKVNLWVPPILEANCHKAKRRGVGAERVCRLKGNITIQEQWLTWDEGHSFSYVASGMPLVKSALNVWRLKEDKGKTLVVSETTIDIEVGILGKLISYIMTPSMKKMGPQSLALFKYWVEKGEPFEGRNSKLPLGPTVC